MGNNKLLRKKVLLLNIVIIWGSDFKKFPITHKIHKDSMSLHNIIVLRIEELYTKYILEFRKMYPVEVIQSSVNFQKINLTILFYELK